MMLFLLATGLAGFLSSALLRAAGLSSMAIRYPVAVGVAYLVFLLLLALFVSYHRSRRQQSPAGPSGCDDAYVYYFPDVQPAAANSPQPTGSSSSAPGKGSGGSRLDLGGGNGEGLVVLVVILILVAIGSALLASVFVLLEAPLLLAEVLVDGVLLVGLSETEWL
jgi:hypothetical protein